MKQKAQRIPVNIDQEDFQRLKAISDSSGIPAAKLLRWALHSWLDKNEKDFVKFYNTKQQHPA